VTLRAAAVNRLDDVTRTTGDGRPPQTGRPERARRPDRGTRRTREPADPRRIAARPYRLPAARHVLETLS
jgi:hypothetical protein